MSVWNTDGGFALADRDVGVITGKKHDDHPWGPNTWGVQGRTFGGAWTVWIPGMASDGPIAAQRYYIRHGQAYLYGKESDGRYGFVRYILGDVWRPGGPIPLPLYPGDIRVPAPSMNRNPRRREGPRPLEDIRPLTLTLDLYRGATSHTSSSASRAMYAINLWITGPYFPIGRDVLGRKPLVFDLDFYTSGTLAHRSVRSFESSSCYHYQESVGVTPLSSWRSWRIDLKEVILRALRRFGLQPEGAAIYQLEFLIELVNAEGSAMIDNFYLTY